jgi:lipoyl(octanoyl) transferase
MANLTLEIGDCVLENYKIVPYVVAWNYQKSLVVERLENPQLKDRLLLLEHPSVYTLGTGASTDFLHFDLTKSDRQSDREVYRIERGGEVTYHCPGQLVAYPILNLRHYQTDLHWYLRQLEAVIIHVCNSYDLDAYRIQGLTGVWVEGKKIAAIGIKVRRWITMHGFAINVCPDLTGFQLITPCGIKDRSVGSLAEFKPQITLDRVRIDVANAFARLFQVNLLTADCLSHKLENFKS